MRLIEDGQKIVFIGDSITQPADGYVGMTEQMLGALAPDARVTCVNVGIGGNKIPDLLARADQDLVAHDPDWITISIGINDVWHGINPEWTQVTGVPIDEFAKLYDELIAKLKKETHAKLALFTTTVIGEDLESEGNTKLIPYNDYIRATAAKNNALLVEMNGAFHKAIEKWHTVGEGLKFTSDGVHMKPAGNYLMAITLLRAWGLL